MKRATTIFKRVAMAAILCLSAFSASAQIIRVNHAVTGGNGSGADWPNAVRYLQDALDMARQGGVTQVWVAEGTYTPDRGGGRAPWDVSESFEPVSGVILYGGFDGTEQYAYQRDSQANSTILTGDLDGSGGLFNQPGNSRHVVRAENLSNFTIDGFIIEHGYALDVNASDPPDYRHGAGIYMLNSQNFRIRSSEIRLNLASGAGGGFYAANSSGYVESVRFASNIAANGGGLWAHESNDIVVDQTTVENNRGHRFGGGIASRDGSITVKRSTFRNNSTASAPSQGGVGFLAIRSDATIVNSVFEDNQGSPNSRGGAAYTVGGQTLFANVVMRNNRAGYGGAFLASAGNTTFANVTIDGNHATGNGGGIHTLDGSTITVNNSILWDNTTSGSGPGVYETSGTFTANSSLIQDTPGASDPLFVNAGSGNVTLSAASPARDAGDDLLLPQDAFDIDGDGNMGEPLPIDLNWAARIQGCSVDQGAFEFAETSCNPTILHVDAGVIGGTGSGASWTDAMATLQDALAAVTPGTTQAIWVADGTYRPDQGAGQTPGNRAASFEPADGVPIRGGFAGWETSTSERVAGQNPTVLSGDLLGDDAPGFANRSDNSYHVLKADGVPTVHLDHITISGGNANGADEDRNGGGAYFRAIFDLSLEKVRIADSEASSRGGGLYQIGVVGTVSRSRIEDNRANSGGGLFSNTGSSLWLIDSQVAGNSALRFGGGVTNRESEMRVLRTRITDNFLQGTGSAPGGAGFHNARQGKAWVVNSAISGNLGLGEVRGGGIYNVLSGSVLHVHNSLIVGNESQYGGGIFDVRAVTRVANSTVADNTGRRNGGAFYGLSGADIAVFNTIAAQNTAQNGPGVYGGSFNQTASMIQNSSTADDPRFYGAGNYRLLPSSPAIDQGDAALLPADVLDTDGDGNPGETLPIDYDGKPRVFDVAFAAGSSVDLGAFEATHTDPSGQDASTENAAPNGGDGNGDGILDSQQAHVTSLPNAVDGAYVTIEADPSLTIWSAQSTANPDPSTAPPGVQFMPGLTGFELQGLAPGASTQVTLYFPPGSALNTYFKYDESVGFQEFVLGLNSFGTGAEIFAPTSTTSPVVVVLHLTDGVFGDFDGQADGKIIDPGVGAYIRGGAYGKDLNGDGLADLRQDAPIRLTGLAQSCSLADSRSGRIKAALKQASRSLEAAVTPERWTDAITPATENGPFDEDRQAVGALETLVGEGCSPMQPLIYLVVQLDRTVAETALQDHACSGTGPCAARLKQAERHLEEGDADLAAGRPGPAIGQYKQAWMAVRESAASKGAGLELPTRVDLSQNYPNPFNPETVIAFAMPERGEVRLEVFDMLGRRVALLQNGLVDAGTHRIRFNARDLPSGLYVARLLAGGQEITRTMSLVR